MAEIHLTAAFSTVPPPEQEAIKRLITETVEQIAQDDRSFTRAKLVFTESPGSQTFEVQDVPAICKAAKNAGSSIRSDPSARRMPATGSNWPSFRPRSIAGSSTLPGRHLTL